MSALSASVHEWPAELSSLIGRSLDEVQQELILRTLEAMNGNRTHAAWVLGISVRTLRNRIRDYRRAGADIPEPGPSLPWTSLHNAAIGPVR